MALEAAVLKLQQQHQAELTQLEETLRDFYSAEWDKTHQAYQEEADKCRAFMQQQVGHVPNQHVLHYATVPVEHVHHSSFMPDEIFQKNTVNYMINHIL